MFNLSRFGRLVKIARKSRQPRISQTELADMVGVTQSFISDLENGRLRLGPREPQILDEIAGILDLSLEDSEPSLTLLDPSQTFGYMPKPKALRGFRDKLTSGNFIVTMEIHPPKGVGLKRFETEARELKKYADAVNVTDNQRALLKLSPVAGSRVLLEMGIEPICQMTCRDRNRLGFQSELLSAYVLGVRNFLMIMGDPPEIGDHPDAQPVFDIHSVQALEIGSKLRSGMDMNGKKLNRAPADILLGSACNPFSVDPYVEVSKMKAKIRAGAEFFQTQPVYDLERFREFLKLVRPLGARIIAGYIPITELRTLEVLREIPGVQLPVELVERMETASNPEREGLAMASDTISELRETTDGVHMMNIGRVNPSLKVLEMMNRDLTAA